MNRYSLLGILGALVAAATGACSLVLGIGDLPPSQDGGVDAASKGDAAPDSSSDVSIADAFGDATADSPADASAPDTAPTEPGCTGTVCDGGCVDLMTDPHNCGACGHDCLAGGCNTGMCEPGIFASGQTGSTAITVSDAGVFWSNENGQVDGSTIQGCPLSGCDAGIIALATGQTGPIVLTADDTTAYWGSESTVALAIESCPGTGCTAPTQVGSTEAAMLSIAVDATNVYWADGNDGILSCAKTGCTGPPVTLASGLSRPAALALANGRVFWANTNDTTVQSCATPSCAGGPATVANSGSYMPVAIALSGSTLFYAARSGGDNVIYSCADTGCGSNLTNLTGGQSAYIASLSAEGSSIYWLAESVIYGCSLTSCMNFSTIAQPAKSITAFALYDGVLYWTDSQNVLLQVL